MRYALADIGIEKLRGGNPIKELWQKLTKSS